MIGGPTKLLAQELQEPPETDTHRTADPAQRHSLQQESFNERALFLGDYRIFWSKNKGPTPHFAAVILLASVDVTVSLVPP